MLIRVESSLTSPEANQYPSGCQTVFTQAESTPGLPQMMTRTNPAVSHKRQGSSCHGPRVVVVALLLAQVPLEVATALYAVVVVAGDEAAVAVVATLEMVVVVVFFFFVVVVVVAVVVAVVVVASPLLLCPNNNQSSEPSINSRRVEEIEK